MTVVMVVAPYHLTLPPLPFVGLNLAPLLLAELEDLELFLLEAVALVVAEMSTIRLQTRTRHTAFNSRRIIATKI